MTIVITGRDGLLGSELCRQFGAEALGLDLPEFDLTDRRGIRIALGAARPRAVINTAAFTQVDRAETETDRCRAVNVEGTAFLVEVCRALDCPLVQISTDYVFGRDPHRRLPYRESDAPGPQGVYAQSKFDAEQVVAQGPKHLVVRTCGLYGRPGARSAGHFVETILRRAAQGGALRVVDDQHCTPSYVPHVARAIRFLLLSGTSGIYHVVNAGSTTWYGFAAEIARQAGLDVLVEPITTAQYAAPAPRPAYSVLDAGKYLALASRPEMPPWQDALAEYLAARSVSAD